MYNHEFNDSYDIPQSFYNAIKPYVDKENKQVITTSSELLSVWRAALIAYDEVPESSESIAEWAMSAAASSPLINEPQFEDVHVRFGQAEVPSDNKDEQWDTIKGLVNNLLSK